MILYESIYEEMNKINDEESLDKAPMNEFLGIGEKNYHVSVVETKGIDADSLLDEIRQKIKSNKGKMDGYKFQVDKFPGVYKTILYTATSKARENIENACDDISYEDVKNPKYNLTALGKKPEEANKIVRKSIVWHD